MSTDESAPPPPKSGFDKTKLIIGGISALIILIVVLQNTQAVDTQILFLTLTMPRAALLFGTLVIGFGLGYLAAGFRQRRTAKNKEQTGAPKVGAPPE